VTPDDLYGNPLDKETWEANIEAALDEIRTDYLPRPNPGLALENGTAAANRRILCCAGPYFALERWTLTQPYTEPSHPSLCLMLSNVGDPASIEYAGGTEMLGSGESCILPAAIGETRIVPEGEASLIVCYLPDLERDIVAPLRAAGYSDEEIRELGEIGV
jgi:mannose-6-phosphate isomerase